MTLNSQQKKKGEKKVKRNVAKKQTLGGNKSVVLQNVAMKPKSFLQKMFMKEITGPVIFAAKR